MRIVLIENFRAVFYAPFYAAIALRAYEAEGVEVELKLSDDPERTAASLMAGAGEVSWGGPIRLMLMRQRDPAADVVAFCEAIGRDPFFLLGREPRPAFRLADLQSVRLATVTEVPTPWMCLQHDLRLAGIDPARIERSAERSMAENVAALRAGTVDAIQVFQPYASTLTRQGAAHVWYAAARRGLTSYTTLNATRGFLERNPEAALKMCRAMYRTLKWIHAHTAADLAGATAGYFPEIPQPALAACYADYLALGLWNRTPVLERAGFDWLRDAGLSSGLIQRNYSFEDCVDMRFAEQALREDPPGA